MEQVLSIQTRRRTRKRVTLNEDEEKVCKKRRTRRKSGEKKSKTDETLKSVKKTKKQRKKAEEKDEIGLLLDNDG